MNLKNKIDKIKTTRFFKILGLVPFITTAATFFCLFLGQLYEKGYYFLISSYVWLYLSMAIIVIGLLLSLSYVIIVMIGLIKKLETTKFQLGLFIINVAFVFVGLWIYYPRLITVLSPARSPSTSFSEAEDGTIIIDFAECSKGYAVVYQPFGHTEYDFMGIEDDKCRFQSGTEMEDPNWDGKMDTDCSVPTSVGKVKTRDIDLNRYCHDI